MAAAVQKEDIEDNLETLRKRSRDANMGIPLAAGAIKTLRTNVVGAALCRHPRSMRTICT